jgi:hypothetical protein
MAGSEKTAGARDIPPDDQAGASTNNHPDFLWLPGRTVAPAGSSSSANLADWQANYGSRAAATEQGDADDARDFLTWPRTAADHDSPSTLADLRPEASAATGPGAAAWELPDSEPEIDLDL